jgi:hypothetical protein
MLLTGITSPHDVAQAQSTGACDVNPLTIVTLKTVRSGDDGARIEAARSFLDNWRVNLPGLIKEVGQLPSGKTSSWLAPDLRYATFLTDVVKTILSANDQAIPLFRLCDNDRIIKVLAWGARSDERALRLNAANILANVVDNTTVCFVLHHLRDPAINANGRANLLGVAVAVGSYAYKENVEAIGATLDQLRTSLAASHDDLSQTQKLIVELASRVQRSSNGNTPLPDALSAYCKSYDYRGSLE